MNIAQSFNQIRGSAGGVEIWPPNRSLKSFSPNKAHPVGETVEYTGGSAPHPLWVQCTHEQKKTPLWAAITLDHNADIKGIYALFAISFIRGNFAPFL